MSHDLTQHSNFSKLSEKDQDVVESLQDLINKEVRIKKQGQYQNEKFIKNNPEYKEALSGGNRNSQSTTRIRNLYGHGVNFINENI